MKNILSLEVDWINVCSLIYSYAMYIHICTHGFQKPNAFLFNYVLFSSLVI